MSAVNGDKARFNRQRKQKIARRKRNHELLKKALLKNELPKNEKQGAGQAKPAEAPSHAKPRSMPV